MNKHFLKTLKRVCRDVEQLAKRGHYEGTNWQYMNVSASLKAAAHMIAETVKHAEYQPAPPADPAANPTMETHSEQEASIDHMKVISDWDDEQEAQP